jgi:hypothetical protein
MTRASWRRYSFAQKIAAVVRQLDRRRHVHAWAVGINLGIADTTARKYLREAVKLGRAVSDPPLYVTKLGATERTFRLRRKNEPREE